MPFRTVGSFYLAFIATATSQNGTFPATFINSYPYAPFRYWESGSGGTQDLTLDMGVGNQVNSLFTTPTIFIDNTNVTSLLIQGNTVAGSWGAPAWQVGVGVGREMYSGRKRFVATFSDLAPNSAVPYRYVNIRINSQSPSSGTTYQIGTALLGTGPDLAADPLYPVERQRIDPIRSVDFPNGGREVLSLGEPRVRLTLQTEAVGSSELTGLMGIDRFGMSQPFVLWDATTSGTADAWLVRRMEPRTWTERFLTQYDGTWVLEEVV
jgi:hypothetical protein